MDSIKSAQNILVVCGPNDSVDSLLGDLKEKTSGAITTKLVTELLGEGYAEYDFLISGYTNQQGLSHDDSLLSTYLKLLKPNGIVLVRQCESAQNQIVSKLKLTGFAKIVENNSTNNDSKIIEVSCAKPNFEVGSSAKLSFASEKVDVAAVWKIDSNDDEDDEIDPDSLLDEDDLKRPDPSSLRVCGTTGKRKACKDCSCGLAEELAGDGKPAPADTPKSSCGSCYLGDAFRCATCPYLGMPAFKPGEKIQLAGNQLQADI